MSIKTEGLSFSEALSVIKAGGRAARAGWNGKGMFVYLVEGSHAFQEHDRADHPLIGGVSAALFTDAADVTSTRLPCFALRTAEGFNLHGWLASQTDMLAEDWPRTGRFCRTPTDRHENPAVK